MKNLMKTLSLASSGCGRRTINLLTRVDTILLASFSLTTAMRVQDSFDAFSMTLQYVFQSAYHGNRNQGSRPSRIIRMLCSAVRYSIRIPLGIEEEERRGRRNLWMAAFYRWNLPPPHLWPDNNRLFKMQVYDTEYTRPTTRF